MSVALLDAGQPTRRPWRVLLCLLALLWPASELGAQNTPTPQAPTIDTAAEFAFLMDSATGTVLYEKNADKLMAPASMAKLMTQEVVFNEIVSGRLSLDDEFTVSEYAWRNGGASSGGSTMFAVLNSRIKVRDLLKGAIIVSANDACIVLGEGIAGNEPAFAQRLTRRARELGLTRSVFANSTGLPDPGERVTARELALLANHIIKTYPQFYPWYSEREFTWTVRRAQQNRNPLLREVPGADGLKTGFTSESGYGLTGSVLRNEQRLIVVVNGLKTIKDRAAEARKLIEWGFRAFETRKLLSADVPVGDARVYGGASSSVGLVPTEDVRVLVPRDANPRDLRARVVYNGPIRAPIEKGQALAKLQVYNGNILALERPLVAADDVAEGSLPKKAWDAVWELAIGLIRGGA